MFLCCFKSDEANLKKKKRITRSSLPCVEIKEHNSLCVAQQCLYSAHHTGHVYLKMSETEPRGERADYRLCYRG